MPALGRGAGALAAALVMAAAAAEAHEGAHLGAPEAAPGPAPRPAAEAPALPLPLEVGGGFSLVDHTGAPRTEADYRGRHLLVYFGYTACPNTCGMALSNISGALDALGPEAKRLAPLFISVDPEYDTPARLAAHLAHFHERIVGLTGEPAEVERVLAAYRVDARPVAEPGAFERLVNHTPFVYLFAPDGALLTLLPPIVPPERMAEVVRRYLP